MIKNLLCIILSLFIHTNKNIILQKNISKEMIKKGQSFLFPKKYTYQFLKQFQLNPLFSFLAITALSIGIMPNENIMLNLQNKIRSGISISLLFIGGAEYQDQCNAKEMEDHIYKTLIENKDDQNFLDAFNRGINNPVISN
jgi:hypothetical protein